jgi:cobalt-zinc-cadmium resistance protein CzcA
VQINAVAPSLSPFEVEKQVTFTIENALAGIPGLQSTRSLSRNGFAQVTAVFEDGVNIYFARQQVSERLGEAGGSAAAGRRDGHGPDRHGLGEIYMYTVEYEHPHGKGAKIEDGKVGLAVRWLVPHARGRRLKTEVELASYLREVQDWIIRPQLKGVKDVAGVEAIGGYVKQYHVQPDPMKLVSYGLTFHDVIEAMEKNNVSTGAGYVEHKGESYLVRATGRIQNHRGDREHRRRDAQRRADLCARHRGGPGGVGLGRELRTGSASENGEDVVVARPSCSSGPTAGPSRRRWTRRWPRSSARFPGDQGQDGPEPHQTGGRDHRDGAEEPAGGRDPGDRGAAADARQLAGGDHLRAGDPAVDAHDRDGHGADAR